MRALTRRQQNIVKATAAAWIVIAGGCIALVLAHALATPPLFP